jgi:hypothetical protein
MNVSTVQLNLIRKLKKISLNIVSLQTFFENSFVIQVRTNISREEGTFNML